jgi:redox-sensitive bicupin YhaK (pirin superfamily)
MSAGTGIRHAEYNAEPELTRIFQIWIEPTRRGEAPSWGSKPFPKGERAGQFVVLASGFEGDTSESGGGALPIRTDARIVAATLNAGDSADYPLGADRRGYLVPAKGEIEVNGVRLNARDGAAIAQEELVTVKALSDAEVVLVDAA